MRSLVFRAAPAASHPGHADQQQHEHLRHASSSSSGGDHGSRVVCVPPASGPHRPAARERPTFAVHASRPAGSLDVPLDLQDVCASVAAKQQAGQAAARSSMGHLHVILGPMFAGKSTRLLQHVAAAQEAGRMVAVVKSSVDKRYARNWVVTHHGMCVMCIAAATLAEFRAAAETAGAWRQFDVIAIDEAQFFPDLMEFCTRAADADGKHIVVAGLSGDFRRRPFGQLLDLLPLADEVSMVQAECSTCGSPAPFSLRVVDSDQQVAIGGADAYRAACRACYTRYNAAFGGHQHQHGE